MLKILQYGSPILEKVSLDVKDVNDKKIHTLIEEMLKVLEKEKEHSAGLSAPQVGKLLRIAICRRFDLEEDTNSLNPIWEIMINPKILRKGKEMSTKWEGCLSINHGELFGEVVRSNEVDVEFVDLNGKKQLIKANGFLSHIIQHEVDHLDGILFLKYISDPTNLYTSDEVEAMAS